MRKILKIAKHKIASFFAERDTRVADTIFLRQRVKKVDEDSMVMEEIDGLLKSLPSNDDIVKESDTRKLKKLSQLLLAAIQQMDNARITLQVARDKESSEYRLREAHFYAIKGVVAREQGISPKETSFVVPEIDLRKEFLYQKIGAELREAYATVCLNDNDKVSFLNSVIKESGLNAVVKIATLPLEAPERWKKEAAVKEGSGQKDHNFRTENPIEFFARVYEPWLDKGITRAYLRNIDVELYSAIGRSLQLDPNRLDKFPENVKNALQSVKQRNDIAVGPAEKFDRSSLAGRELERKERQRLGQAKAYREK